MSVNAAQRELAAGLQATRPPHRLERLRAWMDDEKLECAVVAGAEGVTHLTGYARYYGGPAAVVIERDGTRTLAVMFDEARIARELSDAETVIGYGERGFGIDLNPVARLAETLAAVPLLPPAARNGFGVTLRSPPGELG